MQYTFGTEERYIHGIENVDKNRLEQLLQFHRNEAMKARKELTAIFTAAVMNLLDDSDGDGYHVISDTSDGESTFDDSEAGSAYSSEVHSSLDEDCSNTSGDDEYNHISETDDEDEAVTDDASDGTWSRVDSEEESDDAMDDADQQRLLTDFQELVKRLLEGVSASCLLQFMIDKQEGNDNDAPGFVRAMLPWIPEDVNF